MVLGSKAGPSIVDAMYGNEITDNAAKLIYDALSRLGLLDPGVSSELFGSGVDGDFTVVGSFAPTTDKYYNNLTVPFGTTLDLSAGVRIFVKGTLFAAGTVQSLGVDGGDAAIDIGGAGGGAGEAGANGALGAGSLAVSGFPAQTNTVGGDGGGSGIAGNGAGGVGGSNYSSLISDLRGSYNGPVQAALVIDGHAQRGQAGSSGGGDGATFKGGGGGGAGGGAAGLFIFAHTIQNSPTASLVTVGGSGGNGGVPAGGNSGGGAGAGGGGSAGILIVTNTIAGQFGNLTRIGGAGGAGGTASGTGTAGTAGLPGGVGRFIGHLLSTGDTFAF